MWPVLATIIFFKGTTAETSLFNNQSIIFTSIFNITSLLVPADSTKYIQDSELPSIFFTVSDNRFDGGTCIFVLEGLAAYEILEAGRDSTSDYGDDKTVYFGAKDGLYKYDPHSLSAKKLGPFNDDIIQLQKANGVDEIYCLSNDQSMFKLEKIGTVKSKLRICATQFVLDTSNNIYYINCSDLMIHIVKGNDSIIAVTDEYQSIKLLRPAFIMEDSILFFGDDVLHLLYCNGTVEKKDFQMIDRPSAFSIDTALYLLAALDGKIYEYNVMDVMLNSMFGKGIQDIGKVIMSIISSKDSYY